MDTNEIKTARKILTKAIDKFASEQNWDSLDNAYHALVKIMIIEESMGKSDTGECSCGKGCSCS